KQLEAVNGKKSAELTLDAPGRPRGILVARRLSAACAAKSHRLKEKLADELAWRFAAVRPEVLRLAVNEAAALAAATGYPTLFLPALAEEKVAFASQWETK